jgi:hypothetical protein
MRKRGELLYQTVDNGGHAFDVMISHDHNVRIQRSEPIRRDEATLRMKAAEVWLGEGQDDDHDDESEIGCAVLIVSVDKMLTLVARDVRTLGRLRESERIEEFVAFVGNSRVACGYVRTNLRLIFPASMNCTTEAKELRLDMRRLEWKLKLDCIGSAASHDNLQTLQGESVLLVRGTELTRKDRLARSAELTRKGRLARSAELTREGRRPRSRTQSTLRSPGRKGSRR